MVLEPVLCVFRKRMCFSDEHSLGVEVNPVESNSVLALLACNLLQIKKIQDSVSFQRIFLCRMICSFCFRIYLASTWLLFIWFIFWGTFQRKQFFICIVTLLPVGNKKTAQDSLVIYILEYSWFLFLNCFTLLLFFLGFKTFYRDVFVREVNGCMLS